MSRKLFFFFMRMSVVVKDVMERGENSEMEGIGRGIFR